MWLIIGFIFVVILSSVMTNTNTKLKYSELITKINEGKVESIVIDSNGSSATVELSDDKIKKQVNIVGTQVSIQLWWVKREVG